MTANTISSSYELSWRFEQRVAFEHLGSQKYSTSTRALGELVSNALDAGADRIEIEIKRNDLKGIESISITDNGSGISRAQLEDRFVVVGVKPPAGEEQETTHFGRFGVGRLAVCRIGSMSKWVTVSESSHSARVQSTFTVRLSDKDKLKVDEKPVSKSTPLGTRIDIYNLRDSDEESLSPTRISNDLLTQFCSYLLGNPNRHIYVQGEELDVRSMVQTSETENIEQLQEPLRPATINHLLLATPVDRSRFKDQLLFAAKGRTVATGQPEEPPSPHYLGIVECPYLETIVTSNREGLIGMDKSFSQLKGAALEKVQAYREKYKANYSRYFIEQARQRDFYPYRGAPVDAVSSAQQVVYDVILEKVNENVNLESMTYKQQAVVFRLLQRSLVNENILDIVQEIAKLSDEDVEKFRKVLEHTTLNSIIKLSSEVTTRLQFLDILNELVYGDNSKHLKERSQLHRILEPHCWLFGPQYHLAASDKSFRTIIKRHRALAKLPDVPEEIINLPKGIKDIPDLFLAATRTFPTDIKNYHLLVELKAPSVPLKRKEVEQVRRYAQTILDSHEFDKTSTRWDLYLVASRTNDEIELDRKQKDRPFGCLYILENVYVWAFQWSEIIAKAKEEMQLVLGHLEKKSKELEVSDYLRENYPEIFDSLPRAGETSGAKARKNKKSENMATVTPA